MSDPRAKLLLLSFGAACLAYVGCTGGASTTSSSSSGGASSSPASSSATGASSGSSADLATPCAADSDCAAGLRCIQPGDSDPVFGGGPVNGYCSKSCALDIDCAGGSHAACLAGPDGKSGLCVPTCKIGPDLMAYNDPLLPTKCHGRNDLRCAPIDTNLHACLPTCGKDSQCPAGKVCDPRLTVCVTKPSSGKAWGEACDPNAKDPECAGVCVFFSNGATACSSPCVLGGTDDLTKTPNCGGPESGYCIYLPSGNGPGDFGYCALACKQHDDCQSPSFFCRSLKGLTGNGVDNGYCRGATACPHGPADCPDPLRPCTPTRFGPFCLDSTFPLGNDACGADAGADAAEPEGGCGVGGGGGMGGMGGAGGGDAGAD